MNKLRNSEVKAEINDTTVTDFDKLISTKVFFVTSEKKMRNN